MTAGILCALAGLVAGALATHRWNAAMAAQNALVAQLRLNAARGRVRYFQAETAIANHRVAALSALVREYEHDLAGADQEIACLEQNVRVDREFDRMTAGLRPASGTTNT